MKLIARFTALYCFLSSFYIGQSQTDVQTISPWISPEVEKNRILPSNNLPFKKYQTIKLNAAALTTQLKTVPFRFSTEAVKKKVILPVPYPDGSFQNFQIVETAVLHPDLGKQFPNIHSYEGIGIDDPLAKLRFSWSPNGFQGMILSCNKDAIFIENKEKEDLENYIVFDKKDAINEINQPFSCGVIEEENVSINPINQSRNKENCELKTYRIAIACTGQYAQYHGGTIENVLAAMNTTMNRVNGIFENDVAVSFQIIPNTINLIFLDSINAPYNTSDIDTLLEQNQLLIDSIIGTENYDLGHLFNVETTSPTGLGALGLCNPNRKAMGVTGITPPEGHRFDVDYVSHEIGHQLGASHTFNGTKGVCSNRSFLFGGVEVGSGTTIMAYAGLCETDNVQLFSDPYFHAFSIAEINNYLNKELTNNCAEIRGLGRERFIVEAGQDYHIPISTPFVLESETISFDSSLTYCWEQMDVDVPTFPGLPSPLFRSFPPKTTNKRFFPNLENLANNDTPWETLPTESIKMNFRLTVRENQIGGGCTSFDDVEITVTETAGPFMLTAPNEAIQWKIGETEVVTWEVANTNKTPINTEAINIYLSTDGGLTYPTLLLENAPNIGEATVVVPDVLTEAARVMVMAKGNIFFDISNHNFSIQDASTNTNEALINSIDWTVAPNPFQNHLSVNLANLPIDKKMAVQVTDVLGRIIFEQEIDFPQNLQIPTHQWGNGVYLIGLVDITTGRSLSKFKRILHI